MWADNLIHASFPVDQAVHKHERQERGSVDLHTARHHDVRVLFVKDQVKGGPDCHPNHLPSRDRAGEAEFVEASHTPRILRSVSHKTSACGFDISGPGKQCEVVCEVARG